jgi:hypothetical protein
MEKREIIMCENKDHMPWVGRRETIDGVQITKTGCEYRECPGYYKEFCEEPKQESREDIIRRENLNAREYNKAHPCDECKDKGRLSIESWWETMSKERGSGKMFFDTALEREDASTREKRWNQWGDLKTYKLHMQHAGT